MYDDGHDLNIFDVTIKVPLEFPDVPPIVKFAEYSLEHSSIKKICNADGTIKSTSLSSIKWDDKMGLGEYLMNIYNKIKSRY
jgi:ubiquitin-protein ligase